MIRLGRTLAWAATLAVVGTIVFAAGCSNDSNEFQRLVCEVQSVNGGLPLVAAYVDAGADKIPGTEDDIFTVDFVEVTFYARPYNEMVILSDSSPYGYFHVTGYDVIWHPLTADGAPLVDYNMLGAGTDVLVPVNDEASVVILVVDRYLKDAAWFQELAAGTRPPFTAMAELIFRGHETGSETVIEIPASVMVQFVAVVVE